MLKGDLISTPLAPLLISLADDESTGCLHISDAEGDEALIYFKTGLVYAVFVPGRRPQLGAKLISSGALAPEALSDALEAQRTELQGWKLGELLVHLGYVDQPVVEAFVKEQVHDAVWDLIRWTEGRWKFRKGEKTREDVAPPMPVAELLSTLRERGVEWEAISEVVHGPTAVPVLSTRGGGAPETTLDADAWSMLCKIDGERSVAELARDCGYTLFEAGQVLVSLVQAGLVDIEEDLDISPAPTPPLTAVAENGADAGTLEDGDELYGATSVSSALVAAAAQDDADDAAALAAEIAAAETAADDDAGDDLAALARLVTEVAAGIREDEAPTPVAEEPRPEPVRDQPSPVSLHNDGQSFLSSVERVSAALAEVLGPPPVTDDPFEVPAEMRVKRTPKKKERTPPPMDPRAAMIRAAAAQELAAAHALAEALREAAAADTSAAEEEAARLAAEQEAARVEAERVAAEEEAARVAAEEEAARLEAERLEAERLAAEEEAARIAAEEEAARLEAERLEAERLAAEEEAARVAAEEEAARVAAEEEAARLEAERLAAEEEAARLEAERLAAEEEADRVEAERLAAEEAARVEAELVEAQLLEAQLLEAQLLEAQRLAEEKAEAESQAWTEYWRREADRIAAEAEAARLSEEASRVAAEQARELAEEAARRAAEEAEAEALREEEAEETERLRRNKSAASAALAELAQQTVEAIPEPDLESEPAFDAEDFREPVHAVVGAPPVEMADTAALLRELSSLGLDDEPSSPAPPPRSPSRPAPAPAAAKKKRGLFGR